MLTLTMSQPDSAGSQPYPFYSHLTYVFVLIISFIVSLV